MNHRRRAVYTALTDVLNDANRVHDLFSYCEAFCTVEPKFLVNRFLLHAEQRKLIDDRERHRIAKAMYFAMARPYDALSRYPAHLVGMEEEPQVEEAHPIPAEISAFADFGLHSVPDSAIVAPRESTPAAHKVFQTVMAHLATELFRSFGHRVGRIAFALSDARTQVGAGEDVLSMLIDWIDGDLHEDAIPDHLALAEMRIALRNPWKNETDNTRDNLRQAMAQNPYLKVMFQSGYYDGATTYFNAKYTMWQLDPSGRLKDRLSFKGYRSGHMMYLRREDLAKSTDDIREFIKNSLANAKSAKY